MTKLDEIAVNIELVLISIIEGVALSFLGANTIEVLHSPQWYIHLPYVLAGFTILLVFWSQAILHAVSFIRWPISMEHMLLYFLAVFLQIVAYGEIDNAGLWFVCWSLFSLLTIFIYTVDLKIIRQAKNKFDDVSGGLEYIQGVEKRHMMEFKFLVPFALLINVVCAALIFFYPATFTQPAMLIGLGSLQFVASLAALLDCVWNFKARETILPKLS